MEQLPTALEGPVLIRPSVFNDPRGFFAETYRASELATRFGIDARFVQDNHSRSGRGVVRGMHFQPDPPAAKLVRCARGAIVDVLVDIRPGSASFGAWEAYELDDENMRMLYVPVGFAHGFCVLSDVADVTYKCSTYYDEAVERGFAYDDDDVGVQWPQDMALLVSERDMHAPQLRDIAHTLEF
jgi:dTDP-4-dehydrorhamnose 3,5-epimerase